ncbi:HpcH/HpaI aldolase/citrate lyase family protein [Mesorhizobium xinjiangense]|uniref:HpcH/HpaI aldolase/citrate lyase family protein n=1 Tax=Mesorhizobium xinjiangense TaxID=2678685 RepID=UPI0012EDF428|nr:CoA ester lyase [Mesorhizobium xinjiangense]
MELSSQRPRRSVLFVPASNEKALTKADKLSCDAVIFDLEDAVAPQAKQASRERLSACFALMGEMSLERVIRINSLSSEWGRDDLAVACACRPDAILLPKVETPGDLLQARDALDQAEADSSMALWAMIETPRGVINVGPIGELGKDRAARLSCLVAGTNDLVKETGVRVDFDRRFIHPWLMQIVLGARAGGIDVLDGVSNDFRDLDAFARECAEGAAMGFDGKTLIHPAQIGPANRAFSPAPAAIAAARAIIAAFAQPENAGKGVISLNGRMVEQLHLEQAQRLLARSRPAQEDTSR